MVELDAFRRRSAIALSGLACLLLVDVSAGKLRWMAIERAGRPAESQERPYRVAHAYYHHDLAPSHATDSATWGPIRYKMRTNSLGFRDTAVREIPRDATAFRILLIGDSFTEGPGVDFDSTFAGLLARKYAVAGIEVLNASVESYSPAIYWKKIEYLLAHEGLDVHAVVVFLDLSDIRDEALDYRIDGAGRVVEAPEIAPGIMDRWARNSVVYRGTAKVLRTLYPHPPRFGCSTADLYEPVCGVGWTGSRMLMDRYGRDGLRLADEHMTRLAALLRARRIPLTVAVYPWPQQLQWNERSSLQVRYWQRWAQRERAEFVDLFTPFFAEIDSQGSAQVLARYFIPGDIHWNASGHRLIAESFAQRFVPRGDVPIPPAR